jgi:hypothetical protein
VKKYIFIYYLGRSRLRWLEDAEDDFPELKMKRWRLTENNGRLSLKEAKFQD